MPNYTFSAIFHYVRDFHDIGLFQTNAHVCFDLRVLFSNKRNTPIYNHDHMFTYTGYLRLHYNTPHAKIPL